MRLALLALLLGLCSAAFCQSLPVVPDPNQPAESSGRLAQQIFPQIGGCDCGRFSLQMLPDNPLLMPGIRQPFSARVDPKFVIPFDPRVDPKFVVRPPQSSIGALQPGTPVVPGIYPGLKLQRLRSATANPGR